MNLSFTLSKCGDVKIFEVNLFAFKHDLINSIVEPLPLVPVT